MLSFADSLKKMGKVRCFDVRGVKYLLLSNVDTEAFGQTVWKILKCRTCAERVRKYAGLIGPDGPCLFQNIEGSLDEIDPQLRAVYEAYKTLNILGNTTSLSIFLVEANSFPKPTKGIKSKGESWHHLTITPSAYMTPSRASMSIRLLNTMKKVNYFAN